MTNQKPLLAVMVLFELPFDPLEITVSMPRLASSTSQCTKPAGPFKKRSEDWLAGLNLLESSCFDFSTPSRSSTQLRMMLGGMLTDNGLCRHPCACDSGRVWFIHFAKTLIRQLAAAKSDNNTKISKKLTVKKTYGPTLTSLDLPVL